MITIPGKWWIRAFLLSPPLLRRLLRASNPPPWRFRSSSSAHDVPDFSSFHLFDDIDPLLWRRRSRLLQPSPPQGIRSSSSAKPVSRESACTAAEITLLRHSPLPSGKPCRKLRGEEAVFNLDRPDNAPRAGKILRVSHRCHQICCVDLRVLVLNSGSWGRCPWNAKALCSEDAFKFQIQELRFQGNFIFVV